MKHNIEIKWTGIWNEKYVVSCPCGWIVKHIDNRKDAEAEGVNHKIKNKEINQ